ncbi:hypothetical protein [Gryllotalpicola ginsengisoli]|nr:hypothetical protein [Gryllotalpicola ginsengisoli]
MARFVEFRRNPDKKASPRWQTLTIVIVAALVIAAGIVATFVFGDGRFFG